MANYRTLSETAVASGLLAWLILFGIPAIKLDEIIYCETHGFHYECAGHPQVKQPLRLKDNLTNHYVSRCIHV